MLLTFFTATLSYLPIVTPLLPIITHHHQCNYNYHHQRQQHGVINTLPTIPNNVKYKKNINEPKRRTAVKSSSSIDYSKNQNDDSLQNLTVEELKEILRSMNLKVGGKKSELIERILLQKKEEEEYHDGDDKKTKSPSKTTTELIDNLEKTLSYKGRISSQRIQNPSHRSGFISIVGAANMGKSTLLNALLKQDLCVTTARPQTTRHAIRALLNTDDVQLCLIDTPGVIDNPSYALQEGMMEAVKGAFRDADVILVVTDLFSTPIPDDELFGQVQKVCALDDERTVIVVVNKIDLVHRVNKNKKKTTTESGGGSSSNKNEGGEGEEEEEKTITVPDAIARWRLLLPNALAIIPASASDGPNDAGVEALRKLLIGGPDVPKAFRDLGRPVQGMFREGVKTVEDEEAKNIIPLGPPLYDEDMLTDRTERFFASEIIRSVLFEKLGKELPYCCEVRVTEFKEPKPHDKKPIIRMMATIFVERDSQKGIVVGKGGQKVKDVGIVAREKLESFFQTKVHLDLSVKVDKDWRKDKSKLKAYGYIN